ncbi:hypothetical protein V502_00020 [Pseudogymnoascus sp. VKM F-4520 (FW-2644)]|nr:hypothetical protein V502_00020 [Pseudogymnoascus sp. VKM F-4520 (FW-2644)]
MPILNSKFLTQLFIEHTIPNPSSSLDMLPITNNVFRGVNGVVQKVPAVMPNELGPNEVLVRITHSGLCGTDIHYIGHGAALGHEGVGLVESIGSAVTTLNVGDRVGGGYLRSRYGATDETSMERVASTPAHLVTYLIGVETFLYKIPDGLESRYAAPLQCAGATVYSSLVANMKPGARVGILGIGGLGHLAIQFSAKLGAETIVFSTNKSKESEARSFGASEFYLLDDAVTISKPVDLLLVTGTQHPEWEKFMVKNIIARNGTIISLGVPNGPIELPGLSMIFNGYKFGSSLVASRQVHNDMLKFAAQHNIKPVIEEFDMTAEGFSQAVDKLNAGTIRYRGVLVAAEKQEKHNFVSKWGLAPGDDDDNLPRDEEDDGKQQYMSEQMLKLFHDLEVAVQLSKKSAKAVENVFGSSRK